MKRPWTPAKDDLYFFWDKVGNMQSRYNWNTPFDLENIRGLNCFKTERAAEKAVGSAEKARPKQVRTRMKHRRTL